MEINFDEFQPITEETLKILMESEVYRDSVIMAGFMGCFDSCEITP